jgi:hypothetical protein
MPISPEPNFDMLVMLENFYGHIHSRYADKNISLLLHIHFV